MDEPKRFHPPLRGRVAPRPRLQTLYVPAPALTHTVLLRLRVGAPDAGVRAPSIAVTAPRIHLGAPEIRLGAPSLSIPVSLDLGAPFTERPAAAPARPPAAGPARLDPLRPVAEVFALLRERLTSQLTPRFGGMP